MEEVGAENLFATTNGYRQESPAEVAWWLRTGEDHQWLPQSRCFSKRTKHHMLHLMGTKERKDSNTFHTLWVKNTSRIPLDIEMVVSLHFGSNGFSFISPLDQSVWRHEDGIMNVFDLLVDGMKEKRAIVREFTFSTDAWKYQPLMVGPSVSCFHISFTLKGLEDIQLPFVHIQSANELACKENLQAIKRK